jgi:hypothetical protein
MPMEIQQTLNDKAQARREDGQLLIQTPNNGAAAALSTLPFGLSADEVTTNSSSLQETDELFRPEADLFYSNAEYAVRNIKQEKATPEQWQAHLNTVPVL